MDKNKKRKAARVGASSNYLWERKTDTALQFWPKDSCEYSLIRPTVPSRFIGKSDGARITSPAGLKFDVFAQYAINHAALTSHTASFYTQRSREKFNFISFTLGGSAIVKIGSEKKILTKGTMFFASTKSEYVLRVPQKWDMIFFHLKDVKKWREISRDVFRISKSKYFSQIEFLVREYLNEISKENPPYSFLESFAALIDKYIIREFRDDSVHGAGLRAFLSSCPTSVLMKSSASSVAKRLNATLYELNRACVAESGMTFAKYAANARMAEARKLLAEGRGSVDKIAKSCGYSGSRSLSKAFVKAHKISPSEFAANLKAQAAAKKRTA